MAFQLRVLCVFTTIGSQDFVTQCIFLAFKVCSGTPSPQQILIKKRANLLERCIVGTDCFCSLEDPDENVIVIKAHFRHGSDMLPSSTNMESAWTWGDHGVRQWDVKSLRQGVRGKETSLDQAWERGIFVKLWVIIFFNPIPSSLLQ